MNCVFSEYRSATVAAASSVLSYNRVALFTATYRPDDVAYQKVTCVDMYSFVDKLYYFVESG